MHGLRSSSRVKAICFCLVPAPGRKEGGRRRARWSLGMQISREPTNVCVDVLVVCVPTSTFAGTTVVRVPATGGGEEEPDRRRSVCLARNVSLRLTRLQWNGRKKTPTNRKQPTELQNTYVHVAMHTNTQANPQPRCNTVGILQYSSTRGAWSGGSVGSKSKRPSIAIPRVPAPAPCVSLSIAVDFTVTNGSLLAERKFPIGHHWKVRSHPSLLFTNIADR